MSPTPRPDLRTTAFYALLIAFAWLMNLAVTGFIMTTFENSSAAPLLLFAVNIAWVGVTVWLAASWLRLLPAKAPRPDAAKARLPLLGIASLCSSGFAVWLFHDAFVAPYSGPAGESGTIGLAAVLILSTAALVLGLALGGVALWRKEKLWLGIAGILVNLGSAAYIVRFLSAH